MRTLLGRGFSDPAASLFVEDGKGFLGDLRPALPLPDWSNRGVLALNGTKLPARDVEASLVSGKTRQFLVYQNYDAILAYNCAHSYALSVSLLADRISQ